MTSDIEVRAYCSADEPAVIALWNICFPDDPPWNNPSDVIRRKMTVQPELLLVAVSHDRLIGTVLAGFDGFRGWVNKLAVHPDYRRLKIASQLMHAAEDGLAAMGCPKLNLQVRAENEAVIQFYREAGYEIEDRISMGKRL